MTLLSFSPQGRTKDRVKARSRAYDYLIKDPRAAISGPSLHRGNGSHTRAEREIQICPRPCKASRKVSRNRHRRRITFVNESFTGTFGISRGRSSAGNSRPVQGRAHNAFVEVFLKLRPGKLQWELKAGEKTEKRSDYSSISRVKDEKGKTVAMRHHPVHHGTQTV